MHQLEVRRDELHLALQRRRLFVQERDDRPEVGDQAPHDGGRARRAGVDERLHVRERVEEEVGRDLGLEEAEARVDRLPLELAPLQLERERLLPRERLPLAEHRSERGPRSQQDAEERQHHPAVHTVLVPKERRCTGGRREDPDRERRDRDRNADGDHLQRPSGDPPRQPLRPRFEEAEDGDGDERDRHSSEKERAEPARPLGPKHQRDREREGEGDGETSERLHES